MRWLVLRLFSTIIRKLDWVDDEVGKKTEKFLKIVILKNMYTQKELDVSLLDICAI
jgi:hypothetical protein